MGEAYIIFQACLNLKLTLQVCEYSMIIKIDYCGTKSSTSIIGW